jgi:hypothetical protein
MVPTLKIPTLHQPKKTLTPTTYLLAKWSFLRPEKLRPTSKTPPIRLGGRKRKTGPWPLLNYQLTLQPGLTSAEYLL